MNLAEVKKLNIPKSPGVYRFKDKKGKIIYIGKAADLRSRVLSYWRESANHSPAKYSMLKQIEKIEWTETESEIEALLLEANLIKKYQPQYNVVMRDDKRYIYIKVSLDDEIPGVFATRKIDKSGKYFGPFTSAEAVRETLKAIRKIWPYCLNRRAGKFCFYHQIGRCAGICGGAISKKEYLEKVIKPIILFLEGKKRQIIKNYNTNLRMYANDANNTNGTNRRKEIEEKIRSLKYQLLNIKKVLAHANVLGIGEKYANDVVELAKILGLPKIPERIEGYDISNIFGREAVGAMVVFRGGEPDKSEYRKFKIKIGQGEADDVRMLKEILERRFKRLSNADLRMSNDGKKKKINIRYSSIENSQWPKPDLIIVDGGKGQLNAALSVLKKIKLNIQVIAISKGSSREIPWLSPRGAERISRDRGLRSALAPDKLFFPGEKKPLELPLASPALHLLKRVRDEAHRFAIAYHRKLRGKIGN